MKIDLFLSMVQQLKWLKELFEKKPKEFEEFFYSEIHHYLGIEFNDDTEDIKDIFRLCGDYAKELILCKNKKEVKKWLDNIALYVVNNIETDYLIENWFALKFYEILKKD